MANLECKTCGDLVDVEARTVVLPFECKWCVEGWVYTPGLSLRKLIVQTKGSNGWFRSLNDGICGTFTSFAEAEKAIAAETDGYERQIVVEGTPDDVLTGGYNASTSTLQAFAYNKALQTTACDQEYIDIEGVLGTVGLAIPTVSEVASSQFDLDKKLIEDLEQQLAEANRVSKFRLDRLNEVVDYSLMNEQKLADVRKELSLAKEINKIYEESQQDLRERLNDALALASGQELIISEKTSDIRIYRSLLGLSRG
jgi:hypothetical protein